MIYIHPIAHHSTKWDWYNLLVVIRRPSINESIASPMEPMNTINLLYHPPPFSIICNSCNFRETPYLSHAIQTEWETGNILLYHMTPTPFSILFNPNHSSLTMYLCKIRDYSIFKRGLASPCTHSKFGDNMSHLLIQKTKQTKQHSISLSVILLFF